MALIQCDECSKEISDKAPSCPHCGIHRKARLPDWAAEAKTAPTTTVPNSRRDQLIDKFVDSARTLPSELRSVDKRFVRGKFSDFMGKTSANHPPSEFWRDLGFADRPKSSIERGFLDNLRDHSQGDFITREALVLRFATPIGAVAVKRWIIDVEGHTEHPTEEDREAQREFLANAPDLCMEEFKWDCEELIKPAMSEAGVPWFSFFSFNSETELENYFVEGISDYFDGEPRMNMDFSVEAFVRRVVQALGVVPQGWEEGYRKYSAGLLQKAPSRFSV